MKLESSSICNVLNLIKKYYGLSRLDFLRNLRLLNPKERELLGTLLIQSKARIHTKKCEIFPVETIMEIRHGCSPYQTFNLRTLLGKRNRTWLTIFIPRR